MSEIQHLITTDPTWIKEYQSLLSFSQGIRHTTLRDLQSTLKSLEKTITPLGDLSPSPTYIYESNETSDLETPPLTYRDGHEAPDPKLVQGIRYTSLQDELKKLQKIENTVKGQTGNDTKKNKVTLKGARVIGMKWWAVAAGVAVIVIATWPWIKPKTYAEKLIESGFVPPPMTELYRGATEDSIEMLIQKAYGYYAEGNYKRALKYFEMVPMQEDEKFNEYYFTTLYLCGNKEFQNKLNNAIIKHPNNKLSLIHI